MILSRFVCVLSVSLTPKVSLFQGNVLCGHLIFPLSFSGWWCTMRMGSALARRRVMRVVTAVENTDPNDADAWQSLVADALELDEVMGQLSAGWGMGLAGFTTLMFGWFGAMFCMFINKPYFAAIAATGADSVLRQELIVFMMVFTSCAPLLIANDVAQTSSCCDLLLSKLNDLGIKHGEGCHARIDWLETRLRRLHNSQGLGFLIFGLVLDQRVLRALAVGLGGGLITAITWVLALSNETVLVTTGTCALAKEQEEELTRYARLLLANASCVLNVTYN